MNRRELLLSLSVLPLATSCKSALPSADFEPWPKGSSPREIGVHVTKRFLTMPVRYIGGYPDTVTWYGALTFAQLARDNALMKELIGRFEPVFENASLIPPAGSHDAVFGALPYELYILTRDARYLPLGAIADRQWAWPLAEPLPEQIVNSAQRIGGAKTPEEMQQLADDGLSPYTRFWIDDMYVTTVLQLQAFRATRKQMYLERAVRHMVAHIDRLQHPSGLFHHSADAPFFWGRGNGWVAAGLTELLRTLPESHPQQPRIMASYREMMAALLMHQDENGMWRQLIDRPQVWVETSCTGMFTFAFVTGVKQGWLDVAIYAKPAHKGWLGLVQHIDEKGDLTEVCEGTGTSNDYRYYLNRKRNVGDLHGQAPVLWTASALLRGDSAG